MMSIDFNDLKSNHYGSGVYQVFIVEVVVVGSSSRRRHHHPLGKGLIFYCLALFVIFFIVIDEFLSNTTK